MRRSLDLIAFEVSAPTGTDAKWSLHVLAGRRGSPRVLRTRGKEDEEGRDCFPAPAV